MANFTKINTKLRNVTSQFAPKDTKTNLKNIVYLTKTDKKQYKSIATK